MTGRLEHERRLEKATTTEQDSAFGLVGMRELLRENSKLTLEG